VCDYVYTDEKGAVLYKSSRYVKDDGKKTFIIKTPDPDAKFGWSFGLSKKNIARVPFRLPRVVSAAKAGKTIVIVEGEKDVLTVEEVCGCAATCNVAGAMKWGLKFPENWIDWFKGAGGIIIIADNDPKTKKVTKHVRGETVEEEIEHWRGQKHAWDVRRRLVEAGFEGKIKLLCVEKLCDLCDGVIKLGHHGKESKQAHHRDRKARRRHLILREDADRSTEDDGDHKPQHDHTKISPPWSVIQATCLTHEHRADQAALKIIHADTGKIRGRTDVAHHKRTERPLLFFFRDDRAHRHDRRHRHIHDAEKF